MAGIAGIVYPDLLQTEQLIDPMLQVMQHRSQQVDIYQYKNIQLGICGGHLAKDEHRSVVIADANIYNSQELCKILELDPSKTSNAQLIATAYHYWGDKFATKLRGDFAIAIFDPKENCLLLVKDRLGNKPLYWYHDHHHFIFGSEIKCLLATGAVPQTPAPDGIAAYLSLGYIPQDMTPIQNVNKLLPGQYIRHLIHGHTSIHSYWSYSSYFTEDNKDDPKTSAEKFENLLAESTKLRLPSSGKIGCFVTGNLGSATVAYEMSRFYPKSEINNLTIGFKGLNDQDLQAAITVNQKLDLHQVVDWITPENFLEDLVKIIWHLDEPIADTNIIATWKMAQLASKHTKIVLSGSVSDELLADNIRYTLQYRTRFQWLAARSWLNFLISPVLQMIPRQGAYSWLKESRISPWQAEYIRQNALFDENLLALASPALSGLFDPQIFLHKFHHLSRIKSKIASFLYFDVKTRIADCYLSQYEKLTSAHRLDWRTPFLDQTIVEYLATCPQQEQLIEQHASSLLKTILKDVYPSDFLHRQKTPQAGFLKPWLPNSQLPQLFKLLASGTLIETGFISEQWLQNQIATPELQQKSFPYLWSILILEIWLRLFIHKPILQPPKMSLIELLSESNET